MMLGVKRLIIMSARVYVGGLSIAAFVSIPVVNLAAPLFAMAFMVHPYTWRSTQPTACADGIGQP